MMANVEKNYEFSAKTKSSMFNRSITMHAKPTDHPSKPRLDNQSLERVGSIKKLCNSIMPGSYSNSKSNSFKGKVWKLRNLFESSKKPSPRSPPRLLRLKSSKSFGSGHGSDSTIRLLGTEDRIVVYLTSLRGVRRTFEDCYAVQTIFKGFRVWVDERDISMDLAYKKELQSVLRTDKSVSLPQVFIGGKYVGGADVIRQLYETGELAKIIAGYPKLTPGFVCDYCGDVRFMPCTNCSGSKKVFDVDEDELKRCTECNENGLIRCPHCCS